MTAKHQAAEAPLRGNQAEYARHRGVSKVAVHKALKAGRISLDPDGKIDFARADAQWSENTEPRRLAITEPEPKAAPVKRAKPASPPPPAPSLPDQAMNEGLEYPVEGSDMPLEDGSEPPSLSRSRAWRETYQARMARLKYDEAAGKLIDAEQARVKQFNLARKARDMLMAIADRLSPVLAAETDPFAIHTLLSDEHRRICNEIADGSRSH